MKEDKIIYSDGQTELRGYITYDDAHTEKKRPGILVVHDASGCNDFARDKAKKLAQLGYVAFAVDMYGEGKFFTEFSEAIKVVKPMIMNRPLIKQRILAALTEIKKHPQVDPKKIAAIGFCFGGLTVLDLARAKQDVLGVVSFHGLLKAPDTETTPPIHTKILVLHGYDDPSVPPSVVNAFAKEMTDAKADWQINMYGHTVHAFTNPRANALAEGRQYNAVADARSWLAMEIFLKEIFK